MYKIRLYASPLRFKSVRVESSTIYLDQFQFDVTAGQQYLKPFPVCLEVDQGLFGAVLVYMGYTEAMMYLYSFAKDFLAELCSKVEEVNVSLINQKVRISLISNGHGHHRGAHGYEDPLCPWPYFEQHRSNKINRELNFGYIRHQASQSHGMFPAGCIVAQKIEKEELAEALEEKIPAIAQEHGGKLNAILRGSDAAFKQAKNTFVDQFEGHPRACVIELYAPQHIRRRNKEIESQLSQNRDDPERQKDLDGMMRFIESAMSTAGP
ncbi:uncharacterized protein BP5553_04912 [Venustampulla echinocandica]|uniref:Uncharacterized protein n=1 Tax=Venustampulla echinocandica TaxID=2656787 RepID=A0A370TPN3_9HELO|nr:uncharacterized protein BP5553_04912 [Venustampulla echinocandica]RDL37479.1 hypothetical protein BP5553_04912 [Venustampulla echinocandica]